MVPANRWISAAMLAALLAAMHARALAAPTTAAATTLPPRETLVANDLRQLAATLTARTSTQAQRDKAAKRLLSRKKPEALLAALATPGLLDARLAAIRAVADDPEPDPQFIRPLIALIGTRGLHDTVVRALARFGDNPLVRDRLIASAQDTTQSVPIRAATIRALGTIVDSAVANALVALVADNRQGAAIQNAAGDALVDLTGLTANGRDAERWRQWQAAIANKTPLAWRAEVMTSRSGRLDRASRDQGEFINELRAILTEQYQRADRDQKFSMVMRYLNSSDPRARGMGVQLVVDAAIGAAPSPPDAPRRLREMVGDSDSEVRLAVARALKQTNDAGALDAILTHLPQETSSEVKVALAGALGQIGNLAAVPQLHSMLRDPSIKAAQSAAEALRALGPRIAAADPRAAEELADELWQVGTQRSGETGGGIFRAAAIDALGPLHSRKLARPLLGLLNFQEQKETRAAALRALGELGDRDTAFGISRWLADEQDPKVRYEAIDALGRTGSFEAYAGTLFNSTSPNQEPDPEVRKHAWEVFQSLLPSATNIDVLNDWAQKLIGDPNRRLVVLLALNGRLLTDKRLSDLAYSQQNTGEVYAKLGQPDKAANYFRNALDYWQGRHEQSQTTITLVGQLMDALLASRQFAEAAEFASEQIEADPAQQTTVGPRIRDQVERLARDGNDLPAGQEKLADAMKLIAEALKMKKPLNERYQNDLREFRQSIQSRIKVPATGPS